MATLVINITLMGGFRIPMRTDIKTLTIFVDTAFFFHNWSGNFHIVVQPIVSKLSHHYWYFVAMVLGLLEETAHQDTDMHQVFEDYLSRCNSSCRSRH